MSRGSSWGHTIVNRVGGQVLFGLRGLSLLESYGKRHRDLTIVTYPRLGTHARAGRCLQRLRVVLAGFKFGDWMTLEVIAPEIFLPHILSP